VLSAVLVGLPSAFAAGKSPLRVFVGFKSPPGADARALIQASGGQVIRQYSLIPAVLAEVPAGAVNELRSKGAVSYVDEEQHRALESHIVLGSLYDGSFEILPWGVDGVNADEVWDTNHNLAIDSSSVPAGQGVKVAVLDTGVDLTHPDLAANLDLADSFDFVDNDSNVSDVPGPVTGHGTSTSGIVAAVDNSIGVIGVAPRAKVIMYRVCDSSVAPLGDCPDSAIVSGLQEAVADGADVVSMSFGGIGFSQALRQAVKAVNDAGLIQVASAGNTPSPVAGARHYPSGFAEVIAVGATDRNNNLASFSTFGGHQELVAPGVEVPTTVPQDEGRDAGLHENSPTSRDFSPNPMQFTGLGSPTANLVFAGLGQPADFAAITCTGKIALISRGAITFRAKIENAIADGCVGAIVYNNVAGNFSGTLGVPEPLPAVSLSQAEGLSLKSEVDVGTVNATLRVIALDYDTFSGTSASAPHVSGVAAVVLSANPALSNKAARTILDATATDLGTPGRDNFFGWGLVNAQAAVQCATGVTSCHLP
jgi:subtilisin family serine protease